MSTFQRDNKILQAFYVSLRDIASGDPRCALRRVSHRDQSFHKSHFKHVLSNKKMEAVRRAATCTNPLSSRPPCLNFCTKKAPLGGVPVRLCVCLVPLCDFPHFDCRAFYLADNLRHSPRYCTPVVGLFKLVSQFFRDLDLRNAV